MGESQGFKEVLKYRTMYIFLVPAILVCLVFYYVPMFGVIVSFQDYDIVKGYLGSPFVGLAHFEEFLKEPYFYSALKNTLGINILSIIFGFPLPVIFALIIFSIKDSIFKKVTQTITYLPHFISWVIVAGLVYKLLDTESGVINMVIKNFGIEPIAFMREPKYFWGIIIFSAIWKELGWNTIIYLAALSGIDIEQYEAATVDGASGFQKLMYITLPGLAPTIGLMLIFTTGTIVNANGNISFDAVFNLRNPLLSDTANTIDYYIYQEGILSNRVSFSAAIGLLQNVISLGLVMSANSISKRFRGYGAF